MALLDRLRQGLARTTAQLAARLDAMVRRAEVSDRRGRPVEVETLEELEEVLLSADVGTAATKRVIDAVAGAATGSAGLKDLVKAEIRSILEAAAAEDAGNGRAPRVVLVVGVNGTGKTTTVAKLANLARQAGQHPLVCAADTFRAAATEQLEIWARRVGADIVRARQGADPAAVVFDAIAAGKARARTPILIDTAGRLHTRTNLMAELQKIRRVAAREVEGAPHEVLLVLDATVGQNGLAQAREFLQAAGVTGIVLAKLDGTARGGIAVAIAQDLKLPIRYAGVGEGLDDLVPFSPAAYVDALFEKTW